MGRQAPHLLHVGDLDLPAGALQLVVQRSALVIEIDRGANRLAVTLEASRQSAQTIRI
jgi:hypothetical protein